MKKRIQWDPLSNMKVGGVVACHGLRYGVSAMMQSQVAPPIFNKALNKEKK